MEIIEIKLGRQFFLIGLTLPYPIIIGFLVKSDLFQKGEMVAAVFLLSIMFILPHLILYFNYLREDFGKKIRIDEENITLIIRSGGTNVEIKKSQISSIIYTSSNWFGTGWHLFDYVTLEIKSGEMYHITSLIAPTTKTLKLINLPHRLKFRSMTIPILKK